VIDYVGNRNEISARRLLEAVILGILDSGNTAVIDGSFYERCAQFVEQETTTTRSPPELIKSIFRAEHNRLLDFGCGTGAHRAMLESAGYHWTGVNYIGGMASGAAEVAQKDPSILFYDGQVLPFEDEAFDVIYSFQVFEHIQDIQSTFSEIRRVLRRGGALIGSVSYLEQIHDYSTFNFTPYGFRLAIEAANLKLLKLYPGHDVFTFLLRRLLIVTSASDENSLTSELKENSAVIRALLEYASRLGIGPVRANLLRLMFSTHFAFYVRKD
jgi:SAM-dependent methyltransferase